MILKTKLVLRVNIVSQVKFEKIKKNVRTWRDLKVGGSESYLSPVHL